MYGVPDQGILIIIIIIIMQRLPCEKHWGDRAIKMRPQMYRVSFLQSGLADQGILIFIIIINLSSCQDFPVKHIWVRCNVTQFIEKTGPTTPVVLTAPVHS